MNYLTEPELNAVKGLIHYLNSQMDPGNEKSTLTADISLVDSNGESAGKITFIADADGYVLVSA